MSDILIEEKDRSKIEEFIYKAPLTLEEFREYFEKIVNDETFEDPLLLRSAFSKQEINAIDSLLKIEREYRNETLNVK